MSVGLATNLTQINNYAGQLALDLRANCQSIINFQAYVVSLGDAGLQAVGYSADDAASLANLMNIMNTVAVIYQGNATQATEYDFQSALAPLTGCQ